MLDKYQGKPVPDATHLSGVQAAYDTAKSTLAGITITSIIFPGDPFGSPYHYVLWAKGNQHFSSCLFSPVLIDANNGKLAAVVKMPFYLRALEVSRPLHFGDYGGLPLKILWVIFDLLAIFMLISGLYLWFVHRKSKSALLQRMTDDEKAVLNIAK